MANPESFWKDFQTFISDEIGKKLFRQYLCEDLLEFVLDFRQDILHFQEKLAENHNRTDEFMAQDGHNILFKIQNQYFNDEMCSFYFIPEFFKGILDTIQTYTIKKMFKPGLYDEALRSANAILKHTCYPKFLESEIFLSFLKHQRTSRRLEVCKRHSGPNSQKSPVYKNAIFALFWHENIFFGDFHGTFF